MTAAMKAQWILLPLALLGLPGCLDPIAGIQCAPGYSPCAGTCVATGACPLLDAGDEDAGDDASGEDSSPTTDDADQTEAPPASEGGVSEGGGNESEAGQVDAERRDAPRPADAVGEAATRAADARPEAGPRLDASVDVPSDTPIIPVGDGPNSDAGDAKDGARSDTVDAPASDDQRSGYDGKPDIASPDIRVGEAGLSCVGCLDAGDASRGEVELPPLDGGALDVSAFVDAGESDTSEPIVKVGRVILMGHDYLASQPAMNSILGNAIFLSPANPVRLVAYAGVADATAMANADGAIAQVSAANGRQIQRVTATASEVPAQLPQADVFLVYGQERANDATLLQLGQSWSAALTLFVNSGGTVVVLDGYYYTTNTGTCQILAQAGLFAIYRNDTVTYDLCRVVAPADPLVAGLPKTYLCPSNSVDFVTTETSPAITTVVSYGKPVVIYKTF
jgi:hypothetical protein